MRVIHLSRSGERQLPSRSRAIRFSICVAAAGVLCLVTPGLSVAQSTCATPDTAEVTDRVYYLKDLVSSTDAQFVQLRTKTGLPKANASKVVLVTKAATCKSAADALNVVAAEPGTVRRVYVYALGTWFAVVDPGIQTPDGTRPLHILDAKFAYRGSIVVQ